MGGDIKRKVNEMNKTTYEEIRKYLNRAKKAKEKLAKLQVKASGEYWMTDGCSAIAIFDKEFDASRFEADSCEDSFDYNIAFGEYDTFEIGWDNEENYALYTLDKYCKWCNGHGKKALLILNGETVFDADYLRRLFKITGTPKGVYDIWLYSHSRSDTPTYYRLGWQYEKRKGDCYMRGMLMGVRVAEEDKAGIKKQLREYMTETSILYAIADYGHDKD